MRENEEHTVRYSNEELEAMAMRRRGDSRTDWAKLDALTEERLEAFIDYEEEGLPGWSALQIGTPGPKQQLTVRVDRDIIDRFMAQGHGYQTRMNAVLRSYVDDQKRRAKAAWGR